MTMFVIAPSENYAHLGGVMDTGELLAALKAKKIKNVDIARTIGVDPPRVTEMFKGERAVKLDEAVKLVRAFRLEASPEVPTLPVSTLRLVARHAAMKLQAPAHEAQIAELAEDLRAFSEYVSRPDVRQRIELAEGYLEALLRRPVPAEEARQETDHESDHATR